MSPPGSARPGPVRGPVGVSGHWRDGLVVQPVVQEVREVLVRDVVYVVDELLGADRLAGVALDPAPLDGAERVVADDLPSEFLGRFTSPHRLTTARRRWPGFDLVRFDQPSR